MSISKNEAFKNLNNLVTYDRGVFKYCFSPNKAPIEVIKEGAIGGTYFRGFILVLMWSGTKTHENNLIS